MNIQKTKEEDQQAYEAYQKTNSLRGGGDAEMTNLVLQRVSHTRTGTYGVLMLNGMPLCVTLEDPWADNKRNVSCIPAGIYKCIRHNGQKYKGVWRLENVPDRSAILIHQGNTINDTQGCILVGQKFSPTGGIMNSVVALNDLRDILPENFTINIRSPKE